MAQTIAVAGGTGFIGRHVVARLLADGCTVVVLARGARAAPEGAQLRSCDLGRADEGELVEALAGCDALVNLIGIKRETPSFGFEAAHVGAPERLLAASERAGIGHFVHVSVAGSRRDASSLYLDTKARGEALVRAQTAVPWTVIRPGVVYGPGDDLLRNLADGVRSAPVFPAPDGGHGELMPVAVEDVAEAIARALARPEVSVGRCFDVVGPERLPLRELIARVAGHLGQACWVAPAPSMLMRPVAAVVERVSADPLITPSQLRLLAAGVVGDPESAREHLELEPRALDDDAITRALAEFRPRLPSVRLVPDRAASSSSSSSGERRTPTGWLIAYAGLAVVSLLAGPWLIESVWSRTAILEAALLLLALTTIGLDWRAGLRPSPSAIAAGLAAGLVMWAGAIGVAELLGALAPTLWAQTGSIYAWALDMPVASAVGLLLLIIAGEEIVWRGAVGLAWVDRIGAWPAVALSTTLYTVAHLTTGPPVLALAAALAGFAWSWLAIRTRGLMAPFISHVVWDMALLWVTPI